MLDDGIISPSMRWNAPLLVVPKKTDASGKQKLRIVVDFRKLNDLTIGYTFPPEHNRYLRPTRKRKVFFHFGPRFGIPPNPNT